MCGSGFQAVINGAQDILVGSAKISLTGGCENMSQAPFVARNMRFGTSLGTNVTLEDSLWVGLTDTYCKLPMALTAENLQVKYNISRETVDQFALRSQQLWKKAQDEGIFNTEITPFQLKVKGKEIDFKIDEHPRPQTTIENLTKLKALFKKDGVVTAGTASVRFVFFLRFLLLKTNLFIFRVLLMGLHQLLLLRKKLAKNLI